MAGDSQSRRWFQSHNGAIAALKRDDLEFLLEGFNPTMVRLLPETACRTENGMPSFNPTMVRLLLITLISFSSRYTWFQSHNGAIAASKE